MTQADVTTPIVIPFPASSRLRPFRGKGAPWPPAARLACFVGGATAAWMAVLAPAAFLIRI